MLSSISWMWSRGTVCLVEPDGLKNLVLQVLQRADCIRGCNLQQLQQPSTDGGGKGIIILLGMIARIVYRISSSKNIVLDYHELREGKRSFSKQIQEAYGSRGHGILMIANIPNFVEIRKKLLPLSHRLANLPPAILKKYTRPEIFHSLGWSCGVEKFHGNYDVSKGSFYSTCAQDVPRKLSEEEKKSFTQIELDMRQPNRWVDEIPEIQKYTKEMAKIMIDAGSFLSRQIDNITKEKISSKAKLSMEELVTKGTCHVGRLLHYFPFEVKQDVEDDWCGWHNDHGAITALTSSMYLDKDGNEIEFKETNGGLFAKNRFSEAAKVSIPKDMLAFQLGESAQILTGGILQATPHCVVRSDELAGKGISRNTFAMFMQPNELQQMAVPDGIDPRQASNKSNHNIPHLQKRWDNGISFKEFNARTYKEYS